MDGDVDDRPGGATGVRIIGDRVHRRTGPWTPAVHALLDHARRSGLAEAPEVVGFDDAGDDVVRFVPGSCDAHALLDDAALVAVGTLLGRLRASLRTFVPGESMVWRTKGSGAEVAHGDVAPWNLVFDGDRIVGLLDWDFAGPNVATYDIAYAAWTCVPLEPDRGLSPRDCARRLAALADAAGLTGDERTGLLTTVAYAQARVAFHIADGGMTGELGLPSIWNGGRRMGGIGRSMVWLDEHWDELQHALRWPRGRG
jgi:hypothetical protein